MLTFAVVIPVHNEAAFLVPAVEKFRRRLGPLADRVAEIHLVENGSRDESWACVQRLVAAGRGQVKGHRLPVSSYGEAVKTGLLAATAGAVSVLESDYLDVDFFRASVGLLDRGEADLVIASKRHPEARDLRPWRRRLLTLLFNLGLRAFFGYPGTDTHGLKTFRTPAARELCRLSRTGGEAFQTEIVLLAHRLGYRIVESPLHIRETRKTRISVLRRVPKVLTIVQDIRRSLRRFPRPSARPNS
jgi:glycosyltransferase involved in cell wall biosynthesis